MCKMPRQKPVCALLGDGIESQQSGCPRTETCARGRKARPPSVRGWEIVPPSREPAHTADSQARLLPAAPKVVRPSCAAGKGNGATERESKIKIKNNQ